MRIFLKIIMIVIAGISVLPIPSVAQNVAKSHLDRITAAKVVRVCIWPDYYSITYRNPKTQQLSGIDIDMANELAKTWRSRFNSWTVRLPS